jgi:hypothetical protein
MLLADLVAEALRRNYGDFIAKALVGLKVQRELGVVTLDDDLGGLLDGLNLLKCISICFFLPFETDIEFQHPSVMQ